jgi:enterochelin esterase family protein
MRTALLKRAQLEGTPLIDGERATFVWRGRVAPQLVGDFNDWDQDRMMALTPAAPGVWMCSLEFPRNAYIEYAYMRSRTSPRRSGQTRDRRVPDPFNPRTVANGFGDDNHFFYMPEATPTPLARRQRGGLRGTVTRHVLQAEQLVVGGKRAVVLYRPPVPEPCPLLVVYDGNYYLRRARLVTLVDNLIAEGRIRPLALALLENHRQGRLIEYACSDATLGFVQFNVLPLARAELDLLDPKESPGAYSVLGASMGGLMALYTGLRLPHIFGTVLSQSGAFRDDFVLSDLIRACETMPIRVWMDVGKYEWLLQANKRTYRLLLEKGYDVTYQEYNGGHNYSAWRDDVWRGLVRLLGI